MWMYMCVFYTFVHACIYKYTMYSSIYVHLYICICTCIHMYSYMVCHRLGALWKRMLRQFGLQDVKRRSTPVTGREKSIWQTEKQNCSADLHQPRGSSRVSVASQSWKGWTDVPESLYTCVAQLLDVGCCTKAMVSGKSLLSIVEAGLEDAHS